MTPCPSLPVCCETPYGYEIPGTPFNPPPIIPVVTSATVRQLVSTLFSYQILATNGPILSYGASGLPAGLTINQTTGVISGTILSTSLISYSIQISATNQFGTGYGILVIVVVNVPSVTLTADVPSVPGGSAVEVAIDGGGYVSMTDGQTKTFQPTTDLKIKLTVGPGSYNSTSGPSAMPEANNFIVAFPALVSTIYNLSGQVSGSSGLAVYSVLGGSEAADLDQRFNGTFNTQITGGGTLKTYGEIYCGLNGFLDVTNATVEMIINF